MSVQRGGFTISFGGGGGLSDAAKTAVETPVKTQQEQEKKEKDKKNKEKPNKAKNQTDERQEFGSGRVVVVEEKKEVGNTSTKPKTPKQKQQQQQQQQQPQQKQIDELQSPTGRVVIIEPVQQPSSVDISMLPFDTRRRLQQEQSRVGGKSMFNSAQLNIINGTLGNGATGGGGGGFKGNSGGKGPPVVVRKEFDREERNKPPVAAPRAPAPPPKQQQQQQQQQKQQQQQRQQVMPPPPAQAYTSRQPRPDRRGPQTRSSSELDFPPPFAVPLPPPPVSSGESLKPFRATKSWGDEDD
jgi:hypothetical protein